jgi:hypothetical protein
MRNLIRNAVCLALASATSLGMTGTSVAAPGDQTQHSAAVAEQLARVPGGEVVGTNTVSYEGGRVLVEFAPAGTAAKSDCDDGWLCLWDDPNWKSTRWQFADEGYYQDLRQWGITSFYSFYNHRSDRFFLRNSPNGSVRCYPAGAAASDVSGTVGYWRYIFLAQTNNACG